MNKGENNAFLTSTILTLSIATLLQMPIFNKKKVCWGRGKSLTETSSYD